MALDKLYQELTSRWPLAVTIAFLAAALILPTILRRDALENIPLMGDGHGYFLKHGQSIYVEGYNKFKNGVFRLATLRRSPGVVVSPVFLPELNKLPENVLSFTKAFDETMHRSYYGIESHQASIVRTLKVSLTPALGTASYMYPTNADLRIDNGSLGRLNPTIWDGVSEAIQRELPQTNEWQEIGMSAKVQRIVARASGRLFVGPELCHDEAYLNSAINYTVDLMKAAYAISATHPWLRPFVARRLPQVLTLLRHVQEAHAFLRPVVDARRQAAEDDGNWAKPDDMLQWLIDSTGALGLDSDHALAEMQLNLSFVAIHTTSSLGTNALYTLAANPELVPMLRDDVQQALTESGGNFTSVALQNMRKLDSFLKENLRFYFQNAATFQRKVLKPFTLSNGQRIPAGVVLEVSAGGVNFDEAIHGRPQDFDALRFYKPRIAMDGGASSGPKATEEGAADSQLVSVGTASLSFGYGRHACPGRFFAANELKMILATILLEYDLRNVDGQVGRINNVQFGAQSMPNPAGKVMVRKRQDSVETT